MEKLAALINTVISLLSAGIAIALKDVQTVVSIGAGCIAFVSGLFAIRYYYFATKKLKEK